VAGRPGERGSRTPGLAPPLLVPLNWIFLGGGTQESWRAAVRGGEPRTCAHLPEVRWGRRGER
jgi:hypothetical protein